MSEGFDLAKNIAGAVLAAGPLTEMVKQFGAFIGAYAAPYHKARTAAADRKIEIENIKHQSEVDKLTSELLVEKEDRIQIRIKLENERRQDNLENILIKALPHARTEGEGTPVDVDWLQRFINKAQDISSDDLQDVWARILAGEYNSPKSISLKTMDILSNLTTEEANIFQKLSSLHFYHGIVLICGTDSQRLLKYGIAYYDLLSLESSGLILHPYSTEINFYKKDESKNNQNNIERINYGSRQYTITATKPKYDLKFSTIAFSRAGEEIYKISNVTENDVYFEDFVKECEARGIIVTLVN
jgi:hypothetical protein